MARMVKIALAQVANGWPGHPEPGRPEEVRAFQRGQLDPLVVQAGEQRADILCFCKNALGHRHRARGATRASFEDVLEGASFQWAAGHGRGRIISRGRV